jgi:hypothetical protein
MSNHIKKEEIREILSGFSYCDGLLTSIQSSIDELVEKKLDSFLYMIQKKGKETELEADSDIIPKALIINFEELKEIRESVNKESHENLIMCESCSQIEKRCAWTYLKAGFNGIEEGDKDDIDKYECIHCSHIQES